MIPSQRANSTAASKALVWRIATGSISALLDQRADHRRVAVVAQAAGVHRRGDEVVAERVHRHQRCEPHRVAEVVAIHALGQRRARGGLGGDESRRLAVAQVGPDERERDPGEVRAAADAAHDDVGVLAGELELGDRLLADHGLVQADVVEHRAERVVGVLGAGGNLDRLRDRDPEAARRVLGLRAPGLGQLRGAAVDRPAPGLDHRAPEGLLVVGDADHEHLALQPEQPAGERQRRAPLPGAGLGRELAQALPLVVEGLRRPRCSACASRRGRPPRTCSRCAPGCRAARSSRRARSSGVGRQSRRPAAPPPGSRSRARPRPPARSAPSRTAAPGPRGRAAPWCRGEAAAAARPGGPARRFTQWVGIADSGSGNWICSLALNRLSSRWRRRGDCMPTRRRAEGSITRRARRRRRS